MNIVLPTIDLPCLETLGGLANENIYLKNMVLQGAEKLYDCPLPKTISDRINHELQIIERKKLANYFLIYNDLVQTATETFHILIAPGHHCVASSFVSYCLGITKLNPIEHGLLFERFLSTGRNAMPEIFIASECRGQTKLLDYIKKKYVEANEYNSNSIDDTNSITISFYELQELSQIQSILHFIKTSKHLDIDIDSILPDDLRTLRSFSNGDTMFIPFFDSVQMQDILRSLDNVSFDDLVALHTLDHYGIEQFLPDYISRKNGDVAIEYQLPVMEKYLKSTHGLMIYQEQLMQMACEIAGFTEAESDELRKALGKKREDKIALFHQRFIIGGKQHGYSKEILEDIWAEWLIRGFYLFTKSHFLCLTMISYQMMYLKVHYPDEFFMVMNEKS